MKIIYTLVKLKAKEKHSCEFCDKTAATYLLRTSDTKIGKAIAINYLCDNCKERFNNDQIIKCTDCGRLKKTPSEKCLCVYLKENNISLDSSDDSSEDDYEQIELEKQINGLQEEKEQLAEEIETHLEALEVSKDWHKRQKKELLDRIKELEAENKRLKELTPHESLDEISKLKQRVKQLEEQLQAQIEVKEKK